jgi:hypothetical protein
MRQLLLTFVLSVLASPLAAQDLLESARFAAADLDGDGEVEVVIGGRIGPYRAGLGSRGELQVGGLRAGRISVQSRAVRPVVRDVAIGDYLGDGRPDVFSVGDGWLTLHRYESGRLVEDLLLKLQSDWTDRVAVVGLADRRIVAVTEYTIRPDSDVGETTVRGFEEQDAELREIWAFSLRAHVGDLTFVDNGDLTHLMLETGTGEEGGDMLLYEVKGRALPLQVWSGRLTNGHRSLSLETTDAGRQEIVLTSLDGLSSVFSVQESRLVRNRDLSATVGRLVVPITSIGQSGSRRPDVNPGVLLRDASGWSAHPSVY